MISHIPARTVGVFALVVLGLLLARAGVNVTVLEKHADFLRDFRGDTVHPTTMALLDELGLSERFAELPQNRLDTVRVPVGPAGEFRTLVSAVVRLSLDDFGAGYASLDYLLRYPVSTLKLDRCITAPLISETGSPLLEGVLALASGLGLTVLAEQIG